MNNPGYNLLRWTERYTKTDMVYLTTGGFWLLAGQIISSLAAFLTSIAFANLLPKETYGVYKYILSMTSLLTIPALPGITIAITRAAAAGFDGTIISALKLKIRWGLLSGLASLILAGFYYFNDNAHLSISFLIAAIFLPFMDAFGLYSALLNGKKKFFALTKYGIISQIITAGLMIAVMFLTKDLILILLAYFVSWTMLRYIFFRITLKKFLISKSEDPEALSYGKHLSLMKIANTIATYIDRLFVFHFLGAAPLAVYSFAIAMPEQIKGLLGVLDSLAFPKFVKRNSEEMKASFKKKFLLLFLLGIVVVGSYIVIAPFIFDLIFPQYREAVIYSQLFSISMLNMGFFPASTALRAKRNIKELYISNTVTPIFQIVIMLCLILWKGLLGLIIARIISRFFGSLLDTYLFYKTPMADDHDNDQELPQPAFPD